MQPPEVQDKIEYYILKGMLTDSEYLRFYSSRITHELFSYSSGVIVKAILIFYKKYSKLPPIKILEDKAIPQLCKNPDEQQKCIDILNNISILNFDINSALEWLHEETKKYIKTKRIMNAVVEAFPKIEEGKADEVASIMEKAFRISFEENLGIEYFEDLESRLLRTSIRPEVYSTGINTLDENLGGGYRKKALFIYAGPSNSGKSLFLNDSAVNLCLDGYNVLYISCELSEDYIAQRTDAKFTDITLNEINKNPHLAIKKAIALRDQLKSSSKKRGVLSYINYAPNEVCTNDIIAVMKKIELQRNIKYDFVIVDYLKLVRPNGKSFSDNTYGKLTTVSEELRALACLHNICVITASQTNRTSFNSKEIGMEDISDSLGIIQTADAVVTIARTKESDQNNEVCLTIAKSRFSKRNFSFFVRFEYDYMRIVDLSENSQYVTHINDKQNVTKISNETEQESVFAEQKTLEL
jgi:replicative DNA helicase